MQEPSFFVDFWPTALVVGFTATLWFAAVALPFLAGIACLTSSFAGAKRAMHLLLARQLLWIGNALTWVFLGIGVAVTLTLPVMQEVWTSSLFRLVLVGVGGGCAVAAVLGTGVLFAWGSLRKHPAVLTLLHFLIALALLTTLVFMTGALHGALPTPETVLSWLTTNGLPLLVLVVPCLAAGAGFGLLWLVVRRAYDDFGRDYYVFAAKFCAMRAAVGSFFLVIFGGYLGWSVFNALTLTPEHVVALDQILGRFGAWGLWLVADYAAEASGLALLLAFVVGLPLLAGLLWLVVACSAAPMRAKFAMLAAELCLAGGVVAGAMFMGLMIFVL